jgi:uncharacterized protein (TIGR03382 family)
LWRNYIGSGQSSSAVVNPLPSDGGFAMYETALDLKDLGLSDRSLQSITFNSVNPAHSPTGVFAIDGTPVPESGAPAAMGMAAAVVSALRRRRVGKGRESHQEP